MRSLIPFDGLFGDTVLDHFFDDVPTIYKDYVSVPKADIEDLKDHYEVTCDMPGYTKDEIQVKPVSCPCPQREKTRRKRKTQIVSLSAVNAASPVSSVSSP